MAKLSDKRERFCREYIVDLCASQAALRVGYSPKTAAAQASRLLTNANVQARVAELSGAISEKLQVTAESVRQAIADIAFGDDTPITRLRALELLGKHLAMFTDRRGWEHGGEPDLPVIKIHMVPEGQPIAAAPGRISATDFSGNGSGP